MREARTGAIGRSVVARVQRLRDGAVENHGAFLIVVSEVLADAVQVIVHIVDPELDAVWIARAHCVVGESDAQAIAEAEIRVGLRHRTPFARIAVEQFVVGPALENEG